MSKSYYDLDAKERGKVTMLLIREPRLVQRGMGQRAHDNGQTREDNPYNILTPEGASWDAGWCEERSLAS